MPCSRTRYLGSSLIHCGGATLWVTDPRDRDEERRLAESIKREGAAKVERARAAAVRQQERKSQEQKKRDMERRRGDSYRPVANPHSSAARSGQGMDSRVMNAPRGPRLSPYSKDPGTQLSVPIVPWPAPKVDIARSNASSENDVIDRLEMALFPPTANSLPSLAPSVSMGQSLAASNGFGRSPQAALDGTLLDHPTVAGQSPAQQYSPQMAMKLTLPTNSDPFFQPKIASEQNNQIPKEIDDILLPPTPTSDAPSLPEDIPQPFILQSSKAPLINPFGTSSPNKEETQPYRFGQPSQPPTVPNPPTPSQLFASSPNKPSQPPTPNLSVFTSPDKENISELGSNEETVPELRRRLAFWHEAWEKQDKQLEELRDLQRAKDQEIFKLREERISKNKELERLNHLLTAAEEAGRILEKRNQAALRALEGRT